jgi:predicted PurR-regulated permease PerM
MKKIKINKKYFSISMYAAFALCVVVLFLLLIYNISDVGNAVKNVFHFIYSLLRPVIWGFVLAYILNKPTIFFNKNLLKIKKFYIPMRARKVISVIISLLLFLTIVFLIIYFAIPGVVDSISQIIVNIPQYIEKANTLANKFLVDEHFINVLAFFDVDITDSQSINNLITTWWTDLQGVLEKIANYFVNFVITTGTALTNMFLAIFFAIYMLVDKERLISQITRLTKKVSAKFFYRTKYVLMLLDEMFYTFLTGKALCSLIIIILVLIPCLILRINYASLIAIIVGVTNMIPIFGPLIGSIPAILLAMLTAPINGLWVLIIIIVAQQIESNILEPKILGDSIGINAFWVIFSIVIFGKFWGVTGMLLAVPIFGVLRILFKDLLRRPVTETKKEELIFEKELLDIKIARFYREKEYSKRSKKEFKLLQKSLRKKREKNLD